MDPDLVLTRSLGGSAGWLRAGLVAIGLGFALLVAGLTGWACVTLLGCVAVGAGLSYLSGLDLSIEERLAYGAVVGALVVALVDLALALAFGLRLATVLAGLLVSLLVSGVGWWRGRSRMPAELMDARERWARREPWPLWTLLAVCWPFTLILLARAYSYTAQGLVVGGTAEYADWAAHLTYAGSFAYGANFPPQFPVDPGHRMTYPFLIDFLAASLVPLGTSLTSSLVLTSGLLGLAFPAVMYLAGARLLGSRGGAALSVAVFVFSGGLGFVLLINDLVRLGAAALQHLPRLYTQNNDLNLHWLNPVLAWMLPQRSVLFGFSLALLVMALLWVALRENGGWGSFAALGVVAGLTPLAHLHGYGTIVALAAFWAVLSPRRHWFAFFVPALALGVPVAGFLASGGAAGIRIQLWWLANVEGFHDGPLWFWLKNTGVFIPLLAIAFAWRGLLPQGLAIHLAPIWLWFLAPNVLVFQPWDWDNTKFFAYWALFGALPVGLLLARLFSRGPGPGVLAAGLAVVLMLAGALDLGRALDQKVSSSIFTDAGGVQLAAWAREQTSPQATFVVAPEHNEPIPTLGGRRVVAGYPGWLWTYGLADWAQRNEDADRMLAGAPDTPRLIGLYGVDYVVLGPQELRGHHASQGYWEAHGEQVYAAAGYSVFRVHPAPASG